MSKKSKKAQTEVLEVTNQASEEIEKKEIAQTDVEVVPATIVEATEEQLFTAEPAVVSGEVEVITEKQQEQPVEQTAQTEQPAPNKSKVDRRPYIPWLSEKLEQPQDRRLLLKEIMEKWPTVSKGGCQTFLCDMLNPRYSFYKDRPVVKLADGKVVFSDKAPVAVAVQEAPALEVATPTEEANEQPAE